WQPLARRFPSAAPRERSHVQFINHLPRQTDALPRAVRPPECRWIYHFGRPMRPRGLKPRCRIGKRIAGIQAKAVQRSSHCIRSHAGKIAGRLALELESSTGLEHNFYFLASRSPDSKMNAAPRLCFRADRIPALDQSANSRSRAELRAANS